MSTHLPPFEFVQNADGLRQIIVEDQTCASVQECLSVDPSIADDLASLSEVANFFARGYNYRVIHDVDAYRANYAERLASEDPNQEFQEGRIRLRDFGVADTKEMQPPRREGESLIFYVEEGVLGIPYRVTAGGDGEISYEPLPMSPG